MNHSTPRPRLRYVPMEGHSSQQETPSGSHASLAGPVTALGTQLQASLGAGHTGRHQPARTQLQTLGGAHERLSFQTRGGSPAIPAPRHQPRASPAHRR